MIKNHESLIDPFFPTKPLPIQKIQVTVRVIITNSLPFHIFQLMFFKANAKNFEI